MRSAFLYHHALPQENSRLIIHYYRVHRGDTTRHHQRTLSLLLLVLERSLKVVENSLERPVLLLKRDGSKSRSRLPSQLISSASREAAPPFLLVLLPEETEVINSRVELRRHPDGVSASSLRTRTSANLRLRVERTQH